MKFKKALLIRPLFAISLFSCSKSENTKVAKISVSSSNATNKIYSPNEITLKDNLNSLEDIKQYNLQTLPSTGDVNILVIPVLIPGYETIYEDDETTTISLDKVKSDIEKAFFGESGDDFESVSSFYKKSSYGKLNLKGTVTDWFSIDEDSSLTYDTASDITIDETLNVVSEAIAWASEEGYNMTDYDYDKDGYIDGVWLIYSAPDYTNGGPYGNDANFWAYTSWGNQVKDETPPDVDDPIYNLFGWASYDFMYEGYSKVDAHTFIHETGHFLGLNDYYSDVSTYSPLGKVDMMDGNIIDLNSYSKMLLGWTKPYVCLGSGEISLSSMQNENACIVIPSDDYVLENNEFDPFSEYILIELYTAEGLNYNDSVYKLEDRPLASKENGVRIYHINNSRYVVDTTNIVLNEFYNVNGYTSSLYEEGDVFDEEHTLILPITNNLSASTYNMYFGLDVNVNLFDEIRLIEQSNVDTFTSGGYQTSASYFKAGDSFSLKEYTSFFKNESFDNGKKCTASIKVEEIN